MRERIAHRFFAHRHFMSVLRRHAYAHILMFYFLSIMKTSETQIIPCKYFALCPFWLLINVPIQRGSHSTATKNIKSLVLSSTHLGTLLGFEKCNLLVSMLVVFTYFSKIC